MEKNKAANFKQESSINRKYMRFNSELRQIPPSSEKRVSLGGLR